MPENPYAGLRSWALNEPPSEPATLTLESLRATYECLSVLPMQPRWEVVSRAEYLKRCEDERV